MVTTKRNIKGGTQSSPAILHISYRERLKKLILLPRMKAGKIWKILEELKVAQVAEWCAKDPSIVITIQNQIL